MQKDFANPQTNEQSDLPVFDSNKSALATAISLWRAGKKIDLTLYAELVEQGYDVPSLERFYRK